MVAFAQCMRSHGVPSFPDPVEGRVTMRGGPNSALNPSSPQFKTASEACKSLAPHPNVSPAQSAEFQAQALKFSACMRSHGLPNFPDPSFSGGTVQLSIKAASGIDPGSPQFQSAQKACQSLQPGGKAVTGGPGGAP
jgi:hypothetical protein